MTLLPKVAPSLHSCTSLPTSWPEWNLQMASFWATSFCYGELTLTLVCPALWGMQRLVLVHFPDLNFCLSPWPWESHNSTHSNHPQTMFTASVLGTVPQFLLGSSCRGCLLRMPTPLILLLKETLLLPTLVMLHNLFSWRCAWMPAYYSLDHK